MPFMPFSIIHCRSDAQQVPEIVAMPMLKNSKHEKMAQLLASGLPTADAHEQAGYKRNFGNASTLSRAKDIQARLNEIKNAGADRAAVTVESLIAEAEEARAAAMADGQYAAAVSAIREKGVLSGKRIERLERGEPGEFHWIELASEQQLVAFIERGVVPDAGKLN
jgi:phage terminase small subunit